MDIFAKCPAFTDKIFQNREEACGRGSITLSA